MTCMVTGASCEHIYFFLANVPSGNFGNYGDVGYNAWDKPASDDALGASAKGGSAGGLGGSLPPQTAPPPPETRDL